MPTITERVSDMNYDDVISKCGAIEDGTVIALGEPTPAIRPLHLITSMDGYLQDYGALLGRKAIEALEPLHVPGRDPLPDFGALLRQPFPCQAHVAAAAIKMMDEQGSGFICGEMGTGKTLIGMVAMHYHALRPRNQGGKNGKYRALVLCPDHLVGKWCREIRKTLDGAIVTRFGPQGDTIVVNKKGRRAKRSRVEKELASESNTKKTLRDTVALIGKGKGGRWEKPEGAEWYVIGRNQAKWLSDWAGIADPQLSFQNVGGQLGDNPSGTPRQKALCCKTQVVDHEPVLDDDGRPKRDRNWNPIMRPVLGQVHTCPRCGSRAVDQRGKAWSVKQLTSQKDVPQKTCKATYLESIFEEAKPDQPVERIIPAPPEYETRRAGSEIKSYLDKKWVVKECGEPLFHYTRKPYRWAPARIIQKKLRRMFDYLVVDEVHEQKSDSSARSMACSKLIASARHTLALTGTIIGGYANHLYPLMMRLTPQSLKDEGFEWGKDMPFSEVYGRIDTVITTTEQDSSVNVTGRMSSMRKARSGNRSEKNHVRPGVMPTMFARHMLGTSMFITLDELASELPDLFEYVGGPLGPPPKLEDFSDDKDATAAQKFAYAKDVAERAERGWVDVACDMAPDQGDEYRRITAIMEFVNKELLKKGKMSFLGGMLWTSMDYPDRPFGWDHDPDVTKVFNKTMEVAQALGPEAVAEAEKLMPARTVGYWDKPKNRHIENFVGVVTPKSLPEDVVYPKEQALIDICLKQKAEGIQTWVYVNMTSKRDIQPRLRALLEKEGLTVNILRAGTCEPIDREDWIEANGRDWDVMLSNPILVETGLDLFSPNQGGHNYSTIVFYETGYNLFTMRQAARRAWRIGQPRDCRIYYLYYKETMQHKAMGLMSRKLAAAQALEGQFSEDGLAAMAGDDNLQMALAKSLSERIDESDMQRKWPKVKSGGKRKLSSAIDSLPPEVQAEIVASTAAQLVADALLESKTPDPQPTIQEEEYEDVTPDEEELDEEYKPWTPQPPAPVVPRQTGAKPSTPKPEPPPIQKAQPKQPAEIAEQTRRWILEFPRTPLPNQCPLPFEDEPEDEEEPEPRPTLRLVTAETLDAEEAEVADDDFDAEWEQSPLPEITPEILARMFANLAQGDDW